MGDLSVEGKSGGTRNKMNMTSLLKPLRKEIYSKGKGISERQG